MLRLIAGQITKRLTRSLAMFVGLLVACAGFAMLTAETESARLQVTEIARANARSAYDILVRPQQSELPLESRAGLVQAGFLSGIHGGITLAQWHEIAGISGVEVAAPVAVVGYVVPKVQIPVFGRHRVDPGSGRMLLRLDTTWRTDSGASVEAGRPSFVYVSPHRLSYSADGSVTYETVHGHRHMVADVGTAPETVTSGPTVVEAWASKAYQHPDPHAEIGGLADPVIGFPYLVEAVDPTAEAKLAGLKGAIVSGQYLPSGGLSPAQTSAGSVPRVPVVVASNPATHISLSYQLTRLSTANADAVGEGDGVTNAMHTKGRLVASGSLDQHEAYRRLLAQMSSTAPTAYFAQELSYLYQTGPTSYSRDAEPALGALRARVVNNSREVWASPGSGDELGSLVPAGADDTAFRVLTGYQWHSGQPQPFAPPIFTRVGTFDARKLPGYSALSQVPLGTYASTVLTGATADGRTVLHDGALQPSTNIAGYPQPAPLMLTNINALSTFEQGSSDWAPLSGDRAGTPPAPVSASAPISCIRVRVKGVTGVDAVSQARVRLAAQLIAQKTGLHVDITVGSSPSPRTVVLAAGQHGRPALRLTENWVAKGVALTILSAVDKKSLVLFALVLVVCGFFVANAANASVRARRRELGILACLGWRRSRLFGLVAGELIAVAAAAGVCGAVVAWVAGGVFNVPVGVWRPTLAVPAAVIVAFVAGAIPAWRAANAAPMDALSPEIATSRRAHSTRSITALAWVNIQRVRGRSLMSALGLAVAVSALTVVISVVSAFKGAVIGTLLGNVVTVQIRGADYAAVAAVVGLAAVGVADVAFLNIRERGREVATLRAVGWTDAELARLLITEGLFVGVAGSAAGATTGLAFIAAVVGTTGSAVGTASAACLLGIIVASVATAASVLALRRLPTAILLTEE